MKKKSDKEINKLFSSSHKRDTCLIAAVLTIALGLGFVFWGDKDKAGNENGVLEITIDGELYGNFSLSEDREMVITSPYGNNTVVIEQGRAFVKEADCPDKICAEMKEISSDGEIICCLPHRLFLTVRGGESAGNDAVAY